MGADREVAMTRRGTAATLLVATLAAAAPSPAEEPAPSARLLEGARVRLLAPSVVHGAFTGTVVAQGDDFLVVDLEEHMRVRVPRAAIASAEVSQSRRRHTWKGLLIGAVAMGGLFAATGRIVEGCPSTDSSCYASREEAFMVGAIIGGVLGGSAGHRMQTERWRPIALDGVRLSVGPAPGAGVQAAVSVAF
jgi:hypothetical protein